MAMSNKLAKATQSKEVPAAQAHIAAGVLPDGAIRSELRRTAARLSARNKV